MGVKELMCAYALVQIKKLLKYRGKRNWNTSTYFFSGSSENWIFQRNRLNAVIFSRKPNPLIKISNLRNN